MNVKFCIIILFLPIITFILFSTCVSSQQCSTKNGVTICSEPGITNFPPQYLVNNGVLLTFSSSVAVTGFCCADQFGNKKCWTSGFCCLKDTENEYWSSAACRDFTVWVQPNKIMLPIGTRNSVVLYVENKGAYTDSYIVNYEKNPNNPNIIVDLTGVTPTASVASGEIKRLYPRITVLTTGTSGDVTFMVNSTQEPTMQRNATLHIMESDYPLSLPEFGVLGLIEILILTGLVYFFSFLSFKPRKISAI